MLKLFAVVIIFVAGIVAYEAYKENLDKKKWERKGQEARRRENDLQRFSDEDPILFNKCRECAYKDTHLKKYWVSDPVDRVFRQVEDEERLTIQYYMEEKRRREIERQQEETERIRILNEKTQQIQKENEYIGQDYVRWNELNTQSSVTTKDLYPCKRLLALLDHAADDCDGISEINERLQPFERIAIEKQAIIERVEKVVALYNDIGNPQEAHKLKEKFGL